MEPWEVDVAGGKRTGLQVVLVLLILGGSVAAARAMIASRQRPDPVPAEVKAPLVETLSVHLGEIQLVVRSLGQLQPRREASLTSEVSGRVSRVSDQFLPGAAVAKGAVLVELDTRMLQVAVRSAEAALAQTRAAAAQLAAEAARAVDEWQRARPGDSPPPLVAREPQLAESEARVAAAEASLSQAELDLDRARLTAPFDGFLRDVSVGLGEFVQPGRVLATFYQSEPMELRVSLTDRQLRRLDLERLFGDPELAPAVRVSTSFAGIESEWVGRVARVDGEVDPVSRMVRLVCEVTARSPAVPASGERNGFAPLFAGVFADCEIEGRTIRRAARLPRTALYEPGLVLVVDAEGRLDRREIGVAASDAETITVETGLAEGEKIVVSPLDAAIDGMFVRERGEPE